MDANERRRIMRASGVLVHPVVGGPGHLAGGTNDAQPTRAALIAADIERKLKDLGQLPDAKPEKQVPEKETAEQVTRRAVLKAKLKSFVG